MEVIAARPITDGVQAVARFEAANGSDAEHVNKVGTFFTQIEELKFDGCYLQMRDALVRVTSLARFQTRTGHYIKAFCFRF